MNIALILAGEEERYYGFPRPTQYTLIGNKMMITVCLEVFGTHPKIHAIQVVASRDWRKEIYLHMSDAVLRKFAGFTNPQSSRQRSVFQGLNDMAGYAVKSDIIVVHDVERPMVTARQISTCLKACVKHDGAVPVLPVRDAVYFGTAGSIASIMERDKIFTAQTPQAFRLRDYFLANKELMPERIDEIRDPAEPAVMAELKLAMFPGDENNFKIDSPIKLQRYRAMVRREEEQTRRYTKA